MVLMAQINPPTRRTQFFRKVTANQREEIRQLYQSGETIQAICDAYRISAPTVYYHLDGIPRRNAKPSTPVERVKTCFHCQTTKPASQFYTSAKSKDGLQSWCRACHRENWKLRASKERARKRQAARRAAQRAAQRAAREAAAAVVEPVPVELSGTAFLVEPVVAAAAAPAGLQAFEQEVAEILEATYEPKPTLFQRFLRKLGLAA